MNKDNDPKAPSVQGGPQKCWRVTCEGADDDSGDVIVTLPDELCAALAWIGGAPPVVLIFSSEFSCNDEKHATNPRHTAAAELPWSRVTVLASQPSPIAQRDGCKDTPARVSNLKVSAPQLLQF